MGSILSIALKDLLLLWRNKFGLFWVVGFPLAMALFFGSIFSGEGSGARSMRIAYVAEPSAGADEFHKELSKSEVLAIRRMPLDSAHGLVARGKLVAYVQYITAPAGGFEMFAMMRDSIQVGIDPARKAEAGYLQGLIAQAFFTRLQRQFTDTKQWSSSLDKMLAQADSASWLKDDQRGLFKSMLQSVDTFMASTDSAGDSAGTSAQGGFANLKLGFTDVALSASQPRTSWEITFPQSLIWALIGCAATFALSLVIERTRGTYTRLRLAPISRTQILAGKGLACFVACVSVCALLMIFGSMVFGVRIMSPVILVAAIACAGFCIVGIMMLISVLGKNEHTVGGAGWAILLIMSMTGGGMVPLMFMPSWIAAASNFSPLKWCVLAFEGAIWRGFGWGDMVLPLGILIGIGLAGFGIGVTVMSRADR